MAFGVKPRYKAGQSKAGQREKSLVDVWGRTYMGGENFLADIEKETGVSVLCGE